MPSSVDILEGLHRAASDFSWLAFLWHLLVLAALAGLWSGRWRPSARTVALLLATPVGSVAVVALFEGNPFNSAVFVVLFAIVVLLGLRASRGPMHVAPGWAIAVGAAAILYALLYPHFLPHTAIWAYALAAPVGVIPCPTLALVVGCGLVASSFGSRAWGLAVAVAGLFYALFGVLVLGVWLDLGLLVVVAALAASIVRRRDPVVPANGRAGQGVIARDDDEPDAGLAAARHCDRNLGPRRIVHRHEAHELVPVPSTSASRSPSLDTRFLASASTRSPCRAW